MKKRRNPYIIRPCLVNFEFGMKILTVAELKEEDDDYLLVRGQRPSRAHRVEVRGRAHIGSRYEQSS